jgi:peptidoglycan/LPS O-acetylase OafA/YrhL
MSQILPCSQRIIELDGLRGLAVLMVLLWHFVGSIIDVNLGFLAQVSAWTFILGRTGVDLFFVLSGFLITGIIQDRKRGSLEFLGSFYARRACRILPPYLLLLLIFWCCTFLFTPSHVFNDSTSIWYHLSFTQNYWMSNHRSWGPDGMSITWSVAIEEQFYLLYPALILFLSRKSLFVALVSVAVFSALFRYFYWKYDDENPMAGYVFTLSRLDGLAIGGLVAWCWRCPLVIDWLRNKRAFLRYSLIFGILVFIPLAIGLAHDLKWHMFIWGHSFLSLFYGLLLVFILVGGSERINRWFRKPIICQFGRLSYSIYLFHPLLLSSLFLILHRPEKIRSGLDVAICAVAMAGTMILAVTLYRYLERPCIDRARKFSY